MVVVVHWLLFNWWVLVVVGVFVVLLGGGGFCWKQLRLYWEGVHVRSLGCGLARLDVLLYSRFGGVVCELMRWGGCHDAVGVGVGVGGGGGLGVEVKATDLWGWHWVVRCGHRCGGFARSAVGIPGLQILNGTARQVHDADVAVIVTNGRAPHPLWSSSGSSASMSSAATPAPFWAAGSRSLWELLGAVLASC
ncbi:restriction endonuclease [Streptomyces sp. NPDC102451]|uniref:restriction endonuclease n=1 Tax=Streptomyces sp. NPDC102451 TaxID=3366177 RepID=UPI003803B3A3